MANTSAIQYMVVGGNGVSRINQAVAEYIANGWQPLGGVSVIFFQGDFMCYQAMTKEPPQ